MKNIQVIDGANNCEYLVYAVTDQEFAILFPGPHQNVEFIEDVIERHGDKIIGEIMKNIWERRINKKEIIGIHGTLFYELLWKKKYYPTKNDQEMIVCI